MWFYLSNSHSAPVGGLTKTSEVWVHVPPIWVEVAERERIIVIDSSVGFVEVDS